MSDHTRKLIKESFIELYAEGGMKTTSVKKICERIPISRNTFYAYFSDAYSVLEEIEEEIINDLYRLNRDFPNVDLSVYKRGMPVVCFDETLQYIRSNSQYIAALLGKYGDAQFVYKWKKIIKYHFKEKYKKEFLNYKHLDLVVEQIASSIIGAYTYWVFHEGEISADDFSKVCYPSICHDFMKQ